MKYEHNPTVSYLYYTCMVEQESPALGSIAILTPMYLSSQQPLCRGK